jgi:pilus assembly protein Flp/PilA
MRRTIQKLCNPPSILKNSRGQTLVEYGLLLVLIAVVLIAAVTFIGQRTNDTYTTIGNTLP